MKTKEMTTENWQKLNSKLKEIYNGINTDLYYNGKNKTIRKENQVKIEQAISCFKRIIYYNEYQEVLELFKRHTKGNFYARQGFVSLMYFERDLGDFIKEIEKMIDKKKALSS